MTRVLEARVRSLEARSVPGTALTPEEADVISMARRARPFAEKLAELEEVRTGRQVVKVGSIVFDTETAYEITRIALGMPVVGPPATF